ncbi:type II toxin-antitoxin system HicB family antitoxin [Planctomicrobium sp. SH661]|uniref:type II toxin-antitoxin system HicB family antitoxin n=1 Tax=Planctomicrobium sp. SH661 TaxID=3448124 RepID=UPI003F5B7CC9
MLTYRAAYYDAGDGWMGGQVLDFPAAISQGNGLDEVRRMLASALVDVAESYILDGDPLPVPNPSVNDPDAELVEPIYLLFNASSAIRVIPERVGA